MFHLGFYGVGAFLSLFVEENDFARTSTLCENICAFTIETISGNFLCL